MKKTNKLLAVLLALTMCLSLLPVSAFAEETKDPDPAAPPYGEPYDGVIDDANEVKDTTVPESVGEADSAIEAIDAETTAKIEEAEKAVNDNAELVDAANKVAEEAANTASSAQQTAGSAQQAVENADTLTEKEAAVEIANAAVTAAESAVAEAENALTAANEAYSAAEQAVKEAQAALDRITSEHNEAIDGVAGENGSLAEAKAAAQKVLDEAQKKLDGAGATRDELKTALGTANTNLETAKQDKAKAETDLTNAKDAATEAGLKSEKVDEILSSEEKQTELKTKTDTVKDAKEKLEAGVDDSELEKAKTDQKAAKEALEIEQKKKDAAQLEVNEQQKTVDGLGEEKADLEDAARIAQSKVTNQGAWISSYESQITMYGNNSSTTLGFITGAGNANTITNSTIKEQLDNPSELQGIFQILYQRYAPNGMSKNEFVANIQNAAENSDTYKKYLTADAKLKELNEQLPGLEDAAKKAQEDADAKAEELDEAEKTLNGLKEALDKFDLTDLEKAVTEASTAVDEKQSAYDAAKKVLEDAYAKAVSELSKLLTDTGTGYSSKDYEKLVGDAGKMQDAVDKLEVLRGKIKEQEAADAAQKEAQYNHEHAQAGLKAAEAALAAAQEKVDNAKAKDSSVDLARLTANLKKAQDNFETAEKAVKTAEQAKNDADQAAETARQAAEDARTALEDAIANLADDDDDDDGTTTPAEVALTDAAVPLAAGPVTLAQFVDYLWRHEGEPQAESDLFADHEFAPAIAWALSVEIINETFQPDELVTGEAARTILGNFAQVIGTNAVAVADLTTLLDEGDDPVFNCGEVLAEFFGEEPAAAA